jgi:hypothetical protein
MPRYTLAFSEEFDKLLEEMSSKKDVTKAEIIRRALASYAVLQKQIGTDDKHKVSITDDMDNVLKDIILP